MTHKELRQRLIATIVDCQAQNRWGDMTQIVTTTAEAKVLADTLIAELRPFITSLEDDELEDNEEAA